MTVKHLKMKSRQMARVTRFVRRLAKSMPFDENMETFNWRRARRRNDVFYRLMPRQPGITFDTVELAGRKALVSKPKEPRKDIVIIYLHGGGFVTGNGLVMYSYTSMLAKISGCLVYSIDYSLSPENKFPVAFDECCDAFEALSKMYPDAKFALAGESAGGNLCLGLSLKYKNNDKITCLILSSPTTDFSGSLNHTVNENKDFMVKRGAAGPLSRMYVGDADPMDPFVSPILGDFAGFPAVFISCDANESLYADSLALYEKCKAAGVRVHLTIAEGAFHAFATSGTNAPETHKLLEDSIWFMNKSVIRV